MISTLMWRPVGTSGEPLPDGLKRAISRRLWDTDGSCGHGEATIGHIDIEYLRGLQDAGVKGADELIRHIEKYGAVVVWHEY